MSACSSAFATTTTLLVGLSLGIGETLSGRQLSRNDRSHPGGGYPLLRVAARFLRVDYTRIMVPFRTVEHGVCVVCRDPGEKSRAEQWAVVEFDGATSASIVRERIIGALGRPV